ncbi:MAG: MBL fold metallo-hydrolase, partial [Burkholderiales bacterium]
MRFLTLVFALSVLTGCHSAFRESYQQLQIPKTETQGGIQAVWMGTAGFYVSDGTTAVLIDPFVSRYGLVHVGLGRDIQPDAEAIREWMKTLNPVNVSLVIVSHSHFDHALDAPIFAALTGGVLVGSASTLNVGKGVGLPEQ